MIVDRLTFGGVIAWLRSSEPGDRCIYHRGNLLKDRQMEGTPGNDRVAEINKMARAMWLAYETGQVELHLRHVGHGKCEYLAVKKKRVVRPQPMRILETTL